MPNITDPSAGRPDNVSLWSDASTWKDLPDGWGRNNGDGSYTEALPEDGDDVMIMPGKEKLLVVSENLQSFIFFIFSLF